MNENVEYLKIDLLVPFPGHPFKVEPGEDLDILINSIRDHGITSPLLVWETDDGQYIILSGHRRATASELLSFDNEGFDVVPCIIYRGITLVEATIIMVDENARREKLLPSEKAWAYRMKLEAMKRRAGRPSKDENCATMLHNFEKARTREVIGEAQGESGEQVRLYIRLTYLINDLLYYVDNGKLGFRAATQLSYLSEDEQNAVLLKIRETYKFPTLRQAKLLKDASQAGELDAATLHRILTEVTFDDRVSFRVQPAQRQQLEEMSANTQLSKSEILRTLSSTGKTVYVGRETVAEIADLRADVARVGNLLKMRHNTLSAIADNPFLTENDRALISELYEQNTELYEELTQLRKELVTVCKKINQSVDELNKKQ